MLQLISIASACNGACTRYIVWSCHKWFWLSFSGMSIIWMQQHKRFQLTAEVITMHAPFCYFGFYPNWRCTPITAHLLLRVKTILVTRSMCRIVNSLENISVSTDVIESGALTFTPITQTYHAFSTDESESQMMQHAADTRDNINVK